MTGPVGTRPEAVTDGRDRGASGLRIESISHKFGDYLAADDISIDVAAGEFLGLLGPSGCGKTTLLRMMAGFLTPQHGAILCDGADITRMPPHDRGFGVVFQNYALFPHMTVAENVGYGLRVARVPRPQLIARVSDALDRVGLAAAADRFPRQLSGGMQQRVAIARALVMRPRILLLDEPLSALDKNLREDMQVELRSLQKSVGVTTVFVTHDQEEAMAMCDRIAVMRAGRLLQLGPPDHVYRCPESRFVATFLGTTNLIDGIVRGGGVVGIGDQPMPFDPVGQPVPVEGQAVTLAIRPESISLAQGGAGVPGTVRDALFHGARMTLIFETDDRQEWRILASAADRSIAPGSRAIASWPAAAARLFAD